MKRNFIIAMTLVIVMALGIIGYGVYINYEGESIIQERMASRSIMVTGALVKNREVHARYELREATMESAASGDVIAKVDGVISKNYTHKNSHVYPGDPIVELINEEIPLRIGQAESALKKAQAAEIRAKNTYSRHSKLIEQNATSLERLDEARANYEAAVADVESARMQYEQVLLSQERLRVTSDLEGDVLITYKEVGNYVTAGTPICMIGNFDKMWFSSNIPDDELQALLGSEGYQAKFILSFVHPDFVKVYNTEYRGGNSGDESIFDVDLQGIYPALSEPAKMRRVVFHVYNRAAVLETRSYDDLILTSTQKKNVLSVPVEAVITNKDIKSVFVVGKNNELIERPVQVGAVGEKFIEIIFGLDEGETVVISGTNGLKTGQKVDVNMEDI